MLGQTALLEHVLKRTLPPSTASFWCIGKRVTEPLSLTPHLFLSFPHGLNQSRKLTKRVGSFGFEFGDLLFVFLKPLAHRLQQTRHSLFILRFCIT